MSDGVFRNNYPGGGATLGSAITRAFAVGEHLATSLAPTCPPLPANAGAAIPAVPQAG
ncbi:hypothetical protein [Arthrobacter sp. ISL-28]|uniref:hypothetical protein n=1 Tax=Arthrobacter sp. ISL-28 TaxID=2819108 RepID=UPI00288A0BFD|nr:hypothetical protein [Arthrobacter sp. ISL-28]